MKSPISIGIIMGSLSDEPIAQEAKKVLEEFGISFAATVRSAHRSPEDIPNIVDDFEKRGCEIFIALAGMAAHLAGAIAAQTEKPVIAVPLATKTATSVNGLDALLSSVQMPPGIPVATVAINGAANAAYLALEILAITYSGLSDKLRDFRINLTIKTRENAEKLANSGWPK